MKTGDIRNEAMSSPIIRMMIGKGMVISFTAPKEDDDDNYHYGSLMMSRRYVIIKRFFVRFLLLFTSN